MNKIEQEMTELSEQLEKAMKEGEGSRGGKVIGHTRSGKPIYESASHSSHSEFTHEDHDDAANAHKGIAEKHYQEKNSSPYASVTGLQSLKPGKQFDRAKEKYEESDKNHKIHSESSAYHRRMRDHKSNAVVGDLTADDHKDMADRHLGRIEKLTTKKESKGGEERPAAMEKKGTLMKKGIDALMETIMSLGAEGLRKALPNLTEGQKAILKDVLEKAKKAPSMDSAMPNDGPESIEFASEKGKSKKMRAGEADEALMRDANAEHLPQGDETPEGKEGQIIKAKEVAEIPNEEAADREEIDEMEGEAAPKKEAKMDPKKIIDRMKEKGLKKSDCVQACEAKGESELAKAINELWGEEVVEKALADKGILKDQEKDAKAAESTDESPSEKEAKKQAKVAQMKAEPIAKSIPWTRGTSRLLEASSRRGQNAHYTVEESIIKSETETKETLAKGGYLNDFSAETLAKSENAPIIKKSYAAEMIEKGLDMKPEQFQRLNENKAAKASGPFTVSSFEVSDLAKSMGISAEKAAEVLGLTPEELKKK